MSLPEAMPRLPLSMVRTARCAVTADTTLDAVLDGVQGGQWKSAVEAVRRARTPIERRDRKLKLPGVMFSGAFDRRANDALRRYSQLLCIDIDHAADVMATREKVVTDPHTLAAFVSPSGTGVKALLQLTNSDPALHGRSFESVATYFWRQHSIEIDKKCCDLARLCFVSYDRQLYSNAHATPFECYIDNVDHTDSTDHADHEDNTCNGDDTIEAAAIIEKTQPRQPGERHRCVFNLARGLKFDAGMADLPFSDLKPHVRKWFEMALPNIATKDFTETWADFVHAWPRANSGLSNTPLDTAFARAMQGALPDVCSEYDGQAVRTLLAACYHLRRSDGTFYLSTHAAAARLNIKPMQVLRYLRMLEADGMITTAKRGNRTKATTYKWTNEQDS